MKRSVRMLRQRFHPTLISMTNIKIRTMRFIWVYWRASWNISSSSVTMANRSSPGGSSTLIGRAWKKKYPFFLLPSFRYGDDEQLITLMGVMQTLVSFSELTESNHLNYIKAGRNRIAFLHKEPLIFVLIAHTNEHPLCLIQQLNCAYNQIISTLTLSRIKQKFSLQPNFDLRRWLSNVEKKLLHNIIDMYEKDLGLVLTCARCLPLPFNLRLQIGQTVAQTIRGQKDMIFAIVLAHGQLVSIARLKSYHLHPSDLHVIINLVNSSDSFKGVESWVPVCLPRFDSGWVRWMDVRTKDVLLGVVSTLTSPTWMMPVIFAWC